MWLNKSGISVREHLHKRSMIDFPYSISLVVSSTATHLDGYKKHVTHYHSRVVIAYFVAQEMLYFL